MTDNDLKDLLAKLSPAGLGPLPGNITSAVATEQTSSLSDAFDELEDADENDVAHLFGKEPEEKKEDPIQAAIKKDPLFGSW